MIKKFKDLEIGKRFRFHESSSFTDICIKTSARKYETVRKHGFLQEDYRLILKPLKIKIGTVNIAVEELEDSTEE